jgi:sporulation protein YlmC with PRC-barrel domain
MKQNYKIMFSAATASALTFAALSQDLSNQQPQALSEAAQQHLVAERVVLLKSTALASDVIGLPVENHQHVKLGCLKTFALDLKSGRIVEVILSTSGNQFTAVPPGALQPTPDFKMLQLDVSQDKFNAAPRFDPAQWEQETQSNRVSEAYTYFGEQAYFVNPPTSDRTTNQNGSITALGTRTLAHVEQQELVRQKNDPNNTISIVNPDGSTSRNYYSDDHISIGSWSVLGYDQSEHKLIGMTLRNRQGVKLGKVENIIVDLKAGRIAAVMIASGQILWTQGTSHSVPPTALQMSPARDSLLLDVAKWEFAHSPNYAETEWQNFKLPGYAAGSYYPYRIEPFNNADAPQPPATQPIATAQ